MNANINEDELRLLTYLHEHAKGYDERFGFGMEELSEALGYTEEQFLKCSSYLSTHKLTNLEYVDDSKGVDTDAIMFMGIWLTGQGEDYMRELEKQPGIARKLTVRTLKELGKVVGDVAVKVLTELADRQLPH